MFSMVVIPPPHLLTVQTDHVFDPIDEKGRNIFYSRILGKKEVVEEWSINQCEECGTGL